MSAFGAPPPHATTPNDSERTRASQANAAPRLDLLPNELLARILSNIPVGSYHAITAARASPNLARALATSLECVDPAAPSECVADRLQGGVGAYVKALTIGFRTVPVTPSSLTSIATACPDLRFVAFCGVQSANGLDNAAFCAFLRAHHRTGARLEELRVEFCGGVSGDSLVQAARLCPGLRRVIFKFSGTVDDSHIVSLCETIGHGLEELDVECSPGITDASLYAIADHCPNIALLGVAACHEITDDGLLAVAESLGPSMLALDIHDLPRVSDMGLYHIASHCHNLEYLNAWRVCLTSYGIRSIVETSGETLRVLVIGDCIGIDDEAIHAIASQCPVLEELEMPGLPRVTDLAMASLLDPTNGPPLTSLSIDRCTRLSDSTLCRVECCPGLSEVSAIGLARITRPTVEMLKARVPQLQLSADCSDTMRSSPVDCQLRNQEFHQHAVAVSSTPSQSETSVHPENSATSTPIPIRQNEVSIHTPHVLCTGSENDHANAHPGRAALLAFDDTPSLLSAARDVAGEGGDGTESNAMLQTAWTERPRFAQGTCSG